MTCIRIDGRTDDVCTENANQLVSEKRSAAGVNYLLEKGIEKERLDYKGFGESQPIAENTTDNGRQKNRRVEVKILD